jgi:hypothetical protein
MAALAVLEAAVRVIVQQVKLAAQATRLVPHRLKAIMAVMVRRFIGAVVVAAHQRQEVLALTGQPLVVMARHQQLAAQALPTQGAVVVAEVKLPDQIHLLAGLAVAEQEVQQMQVD